MTKDILEFAQSLADASRLVIQPYFRKNVGVIDKADESPVTIADKNAEEKIRSLIEERFPEHGIFGEEHGVKQGDGTHMWVLDPIDGTRSFICGAPWFGTLIAFLRNGVPEVGVLDVPMLDERWSATLNSTTYNGTCAQVRTDIPLNRASLFTTDLDLFDKTQRSAFERLKSRVKCTRYGSDCYAYGLLASGHIDLVVEAGLQPYDAMALVPVIKGAGGIVTGWKGEDITLDWDGRIIAAASKKLHDAALYELNK